MKSNHEELNQVLKELKAGKTVAPITIRNFLYWFDAQRRTSANVEYINGELAKVGVRTVPDYLNIWVDTPITFELEADHVGKDEANTKKKQNENKSDPSKIEVDDPSFRIGKIPSANNPPVSVKPNSSLLEATTLMLARNFSQLPVMTTDREVKGVISWESIGKRSAVSSGGSDAQAYMDEPYEISSSASLFAGIKIILEHNYVLVRAPDKKISGIVTATDIALQFEEISTPFLLLAEIENNIRLLISNKLSLADIKDACGEENLPTDFSHVSELSFGHYVRILGYEANWKKVDLNLDRGAFCEELSAVNKIRNEVMHFDPDPIVEKDIVKLRNVSKLFETLRGIRAFQKK